MAKAHQHVSPDCRASDTADSGGTLDHEVRTNVTRMTRGTIRITSAFMSALSRTLDLCKSLGERARSPLVTEDAYTVDRALEHGVRKRRQLRALDEKDRVIPWIGTCPRSRPG